MASRRGVKDRQAEVIVELGITRRDLLAGVRDYVGGGDEES